MSLTRLRTFDITLIILAILYFLVISVLFVFNNQLIVCALFTLVTFVIQFIIIHNLESRVQNNSFEDISILNNWSLYITANLFLFIQIFASIILLALKINFGISLIIQALILGIFIIIELGLYRSVEYIEYVEEKTKQQIAFLESMKKEVKILIEISDESNKDDLKELYETVRYANPVSNEEVLNLEYEIKDRLSQLRVALNRKNQEETSNLINLIESLFKEREIILKKV